MKPTMLAERSRMLAAISAQKRDGLAHSLAVWQARAHRLDRVTQSVRAYAGWAGLVGGFGMGLLAALKPRLLFRGLRVAWPLRRTLRRILA